MFLAPALLGCCQHGDRDISGAVDVPARPDGRLQVLAAPGTQIAVAEGLPA